MTTATAPRAERTSGMSVAHDRATITVGVVLRLAAAYLWYENLSWKNPPDFGKSDGGGLTVTRTPPSPTPCWGYGHRSSRTWCCRTSPCSDGSPS